MKMLIVTFSLNLSDFFFKAHNFTFEKCLFLFICHIWLLMFFKMFY